MMYIIKDGSIVTLFVQGSETLVKGKSKWIDPICLSIATPIGSVAITRDEISNVTRTGNEFNVYLYGLIIRMSPAFASDEGVVTFDEWMVKVDQELIKMSGVSAHDLPDVAFRDNFDDGASPKDMAEIALEEGGWPG